MNAAANAPLETTDPATWTVTCRRCEHKACDGTDCAPPMTRAEATAGGTVYRFRFGKRA